MTEMLQWFVGGVLIGAVIGWVIAAWGSRDIDWSEVAAELMKADREGKL